MRAYGGGRITTAATATLPAGSLYAIAARPLYVVEVGVFNTTTTSTSVALARFSTAGTPGAGVIFTFGGKGLRVPAGTANGVGLYVPNGTGQIWDFYYAWDE